MNGYRFIVDRVAVGKPVSRGKGRGLWTWLCFDCGEGGSVDSLNTAERRALSHTHGGLGAPHTPSQKQQGGTAEYEYSS